MISINHTAPRPLMCYLEPLRFSSPSAATHAVPSILYNRPRFASIQSATVDNGVGTGRVMNLRWKEAPYYLRCCLTVKIRPRRGEECNKGWLRGRLGTASWSKIVHVTAGNGTGWAGLGWTGLDWGMEQRSGRPGSARRGDGYCLYCRTAHTSGTEKLRVAHLLPQPLWSPKCHYRAPSWAGRIRPASH